MGIFLGSSIPEPRNEELDQIGEEPEDKQAVYYDGCPDPAILGPREEPLSHELGLLPQPIADNSDGREILDELAVRPQRMFRRPVLIE